MRNNVKPDGTDGSAGGTDSAFHRIDPDGRTSIWECGIGISNTVAWSPDDRRFYFGDSLANVISVNDYDVTNGAVADKRPFFRRLRARYSRWFSDRLRGSFVELSSWSWLHRTRQA